MHMRKNKNKLSLCTFVHHYSGTTFIQYPYIYTYIYGFFISEGKTFLVVVPFQRFSFVLFPICVAGGINKYASGKKTGAGFRGGQSRQCRMSPMKSEAKKLLFANIIWVTTRRIVNMPIIGTTTENVCSYSGLRLIQPRLMHPVA